MLVDTSLVARVALFPAIEAAQIQFSAHKRT